MLRQLRALGVPSVLAAQRGGFTEQLPIGDIARAFRGLVDFLPRPSTSGGAGVATKETDVQLTVVRILQETLAAYKADYSRPTTGAKAKAEPETHRSDEALPRALEAAMPDGAVGEGDGDGKGERV